MAKHKNWLEDKESEMTNNHTPMDTVSNPDTLEDLFVSDAENEVKQIEVKEAVKESKKEDKPISKAGKPIERTGTVLYYAGNFTVVESEGVRYLLDGKQGIRGREITFIK